MDPDKVKILKKIGKYASYGALGALVLFSSVPARTAIRSAVDNRIRQKVRPKIGSVLYTDLAAGYAEHSGIYVGGDDEKCIVELQNDHGECIIKRVSPAEFTNGGLGNTILVSCSGVEAVGNEDFARNALEMVGCDLGKYHLLKNNCHMFTASCMNILSGGSGDRGAVPVKKTVVSHIFQNLDMTLTHLKCRAGELIGADNWRVWDYRREVVPDVPAESAPAED